ncbi:MAG TPA: sigma 54-interacting transcriptional regulator [Bacillota bacterium]|nr:sigma 54-interacting transcriptional regulator [Bacillota bacterium]
MNREFVVKNYRELLAILNCIKVGVYITDGEGNTIMLNDESSKTGGLTREEVLGKNMRELEALGFVENSITLKTLRSGAEENMIQNLGDGGKIYVTGVPLYNDGSNIGLIISTERDITETLQLRELLKERDQNTEKYQKEIEYLKMQNIVMWGNLIAEDDSSKQTAEKARRIAGLGTTVLLIGESGTGKEVYANFIYQNSTRVGKPFIKVNCAAIPENLLESEMFGYEKGAFTGADKNGKMGLFEMANHGTIFLDEIGDIPVHLQPKLLRVLQEKEIMRVGGEKTISLDVRLIAATSKDLEKEIEKGNFRRDLYYRLNILPIELTPLRGKSKDIRALSKYFVESFNKEYKIRKTITEDAIDALQSYKWPGNIRELENIIERLMISFDGDKITRFQVETAIGVIKKEDSINHENLEGKTITELIEDYEKNILVRMLEKYKRPSVVARKLDMNKSTLSRKMKKYGI